MGDFNDEPGDESISMVLGAKSDTAGMHNTDIVDLMALLPKTEGSHKYRESWAYLDHFMVSGTLIGKSPNLHLSKTGAKVFKAPFLLEDDNQYLGKKPFRTYAGPHYLGGYSDHLPVFIDLLYY